MQFSCIHRDLPRTSYNVSSELQTTRRYKCGHWRTSFSSGMTKIGSSHSRTRPLDSPAVGGPVALRAIVFIVERLLHSLTAVFTDHWSTGTKVQGQPIETQRQRCKVVSLKHRDSAHSFKTAWNVADMRNPTFFKTLISIPIHFFKGPGRPMDIPPFV